MKLTEAEKIRRAKIQLADIQWVAWDTKKPYAHFCKVWLTTRMYQKFEKLLNEIGMSAAYTYAWQNGKFRIDIPSAD